MSQKNLKQIPLYIMVYDYPDYPSTISRGSEVSLSFPISVIVSSVLTPVEILKCLFSNLADPTISCDFSYLYYKQKFYNNNNIGFSILSSIHVLPMDGWIINIKKNFYFVRVDF